MECGVRLALWWDNDVGGHFFATYTPDRLCGCQKGKWNHIKQFNSLTEPQVYTLGTNASESLQFNAGPFQAPAGVRTRDSPQMKGILPLDHW